MAEFLPMRPGRLSHVLLGVLLVNAAAILCFRFFTTVDGPLHVLHASLMDAPWSEVDHQAHGFAYEHNERATWLGDWILVVLLAFATPERAHDLIMVLASCAMVVSVFAFLRAHGVRIGMAILWLAPITLNTLLIMGLLNFLLGTAIALGAVAWWKWPGRTPRVRWAGLLLGLALAICTHRGAPVLLGLIFLPTFAFDRYGGIAASKGGRARSWRSLILVVIIVLVIAYALGRTLLMTSELLPTEWPALTNDFLLRPYFLLDHARELWLVRGIGLLFLIAVLAGSVVRWRLGRRVFWHDTLIVLVLAFAAIAWWGNTPHGRLLILSDRAQWVVAVVLVLWLCAVADAARAGIGRVIGGAALCALPLHLVRIVQAEEFLSQFKAAHEATLEACHALAPGSLVFVVRSGGERMLQHEVSFVAIRHGGVVIAPTAQLRYVDPNAWADKEHWERFTRDPYWLLRHWRTGLPPEVDQVLFLGDGIERTVSKPPWPSLLGERYRLTFTNGYARIYTAIPNGDP